jgi:hypothetical protein
MPFSDPKTRAPLLILIVVLACATIIAVTVILTGNVETTSPTVTALIGFFVTTATSMVAVIYSGLAAKEARQVGEDMRNGVMTETVKTALNETGVTEAVAQATTSTPAALAALTRLLENIETKPEGITRRETNGGLE